MRTRGRLPAVIAGGALLAGVLSGCTQERPSTPAQGLAGVDSLPAVAQLEDAAERLRARRLPVRVAPALPGTQVSAVRAPDGRVCVMVVGLAVGPLHADVGGVGRGRCPDGLVLWTAAGDPLPVLPQA